MYASRSARWCVSHCCGVRSRQPTLQYRIHLESGSLALGAIDARLAAVRRLAYEAADAGLLSPELAAGIRRVKGVKEVGDPSGKLVGRDRRTGFVASAQCRNAQGGANRTIITVLLGCGLRRRDLADLSFDDLQRRGDRWAIVDLLRKGGHVRTVPTIRSNSNNPKNEVQFPIETRFLPLSG